jgi:hypothetical protein
MKAARGFLLQPDSLIMACCAASVLCFCAAYALAGIWWAAGLSLLLGLLWIPAYKHPVPILVSFCLVVFTGLGVVGILLGLQAAWITIGLTAALAAWDLLFLNASLKNTPDDAGTRLFHTRHLSSLLLALGAGLLAALVGQLFSFQVPFIGMLVMAALVAWGLERTWVRFHIRGKK